jgi:anti-anti-sigma factor
LREGEERSMQLTIQSETVGEVVAVRCRGRIVTGEEAKFLQAEVERLTQLRKNVVMQLGEVNYMDSGGLGTLVRLLGMLRAAKGDLKLCEVTPFVEKVLQATNLLGVFRPYASEAEAIGAFSARPHALDEPARAASGRIVCLDSSLDLLAYLRVLLQRSGYEVYTTQYVTDAVTLARGAGSSVVICGPGMKDKDSVTGRFRERAPEARMLHLAEDFSTSDADRAGPELVARVREMLAGQ